jgi:hypothetical protein
VNSALAGSGLVYGAGIGRFRKPHFFLGELDREERRGDARLLVCGCEYARDVAAIPAASQGATLIVRREALRQWLWEKAEGWNVKQQDGALKSALLAYGFDLDPQAAIERMTEGEVETLICTRRASSPPAACSAAPGRKSWPGWAASAPRFSPAPSRTIWPTAW